MKDFIKSLLELKIAPAIMYYDQDRKRNDYLDYVSDSTLAFFKNEKKVIKGVAILTSRHNIVALRLINPNKLRLNQFMDKLGVKSDYTWSIINERDVLIILRVMNVPANFFFPFDAEVKQGLSERLIMSQPNTMLTHILIADEVGTNLLQQVPTKEKPPHEMQYSQLLHALSDYVDVQKFLDKEMNEPTTGAVGLEQDIETPLFPTRVYSILPKLLKSYTGHFQLPREKDLSLLSAIAVISSVIPNIVSRHRNKKIWPHMYVVVTAPPASGKGVIGDSGFLVSKIEKHLRKRFEDEVREYKREYAKYKAEEIEDEPEKPQLKTIQLPTDTSFIALFEQLIANGESGLMLETEIDSFVNAGKQEWGNYSVLNRKATHHEPHMLDRKGLATPPYVESPKIAMVLGGTIGQFFRLFPSTEDGLYSRFLVYCYRLKEITLLNPFSNNDGITYDVVMDDCAQVIFDLYSQLSQSQEIEFSWTTTQSDRLYHEFKLILSKVGKLYGDNASSVILRYMLSATRIGMVMATLNAWDAGTLFKDKRLQADDSIMEAVLDIIQVSIQHSLLMMANIDAMTKTKPVDMKSHGLLRFLTALPEGKPFKTKDAIQLGHSLGISERSVADYLNSLCKSKHLIQIGHGEYKKGR